jgi:hypothetical protein
MNDVINLNRARKRKARAAAGAGAAANRLLFGLTKTEKAAAHASKAKADRALEAHKREP